MYVFYVRVFLIATVFLTVFFVLILGLLHRKSWVFHIMDPEMNLTFENKFYSIKLTLVQGRLIFQSAAF